MMRAWAAVAGVVWLGAGGCWTPLTLDEKEHAQTDADADTDVDTDVDADTDADTDTDPCGGCGGGLVCDGTTCVACWDSDGEDGVDEGCDATRPFCDEGTRACGACRGHGDCTAEVCDPEDRVCRGCEEADECEAAGLGSGCFDGGCYECDADVDCGAARTCATVAHVCRDVAPGTVRECEACESDTQCDDPGGVPMSCVVVRLDAVEVGTYCARPVGAGCPAPWRATDGFCLPPPGATCEAVLDLNEECAADDECGKDDLVDGFCVDEGDGVDRCSHPCSASGDCRGGRACVPGTPDHCETD